MLGISSIKYYSVNNNVDNYMSKGLKEYNMLISGI